MQERTKQEASQDIDYVIELNLRHRKLYEKLHFLFSFAFVAAGPAVFAFSGTWSAFFAVIITLLGITSFLVNPSLKAEMYEQQRKRYLLLKSELDGLSLAEIDARTSKIRLDHRSHDVRALEDVAFTANRLRHNLPDSGAKKAC